MLLGAYNGLLIPLRGAYTVYAVLARLRGVPGSELRQRLGWWEPGSGRPVWIQAASVGEAGVAAALVSGLRAERPSLPLLVTTTTRTGQAAAQRALPDSVRRGYFPLDFPAAVRRALGAVHPAALVLVETELWPNLLIEAAARGIPVLVANGRLSDRAFRRCRAAGSLFKSALAGVTRACVQTSLDRDRFLALGVPADRICVTGNVKFAASGAARDGARSRTAIGAGPQDEIWIAGSTAEGEESAVLAAFGGLPRGGARRILVIAPRRPERFEEVGRLLAASGLRWRRRSGIAGADGAAGAASDAGASAAPVSAGAGGAGAASGVGAPEVVLLDTLGELSSLYAAATVAFVGGTLAPKGGHNIIEPAATGVAPVFGPHVQNVREVAARLLEAGGAFQVQDAADLSRTFAQLASDPELRRRAGQSARALVASQAGSLDATLREILPLLPAGGRATA